MGRASRAGILFGAVLGIVNGVLVNVVQINSFIATLASSIVFRGIAILVTGGLIVTVTDEAFSILGTETFLGAKYTVWVFALVFVADLVPPGDGRRSAATSTPSAATPERRGSPGIQVAQVRTIAFIISGLCAGIAGVLAASRTSSAQPDLGMDLALQAIAASVVGGTSIMGGQGAIWRAVLGVLILAMIGNGFNLLGIDTIYQQIVQGCSSCSPSVWTNCCGAGSRTTGAALRIRIAPHVRDRLDLDQHPRHLVEVRSDGRACRFGIVEILGVDGVEAGEHARVRQVDVDLEDVVHRRPARLQHRLDAVQHAPRLLLQRLADDLAGLRVDRPGSRRVDEIPDSQPCEYAPSGGPAWSFVLRH